MDRRCNILAAFFGAECQVKDGRPEEADEHAQADLRAQQDMAEWALIVALVSIPGVIVSSLGLWALYWTFAQTREIAKSQERAVLYAFALEMDAPDEMNGHVYLKLGVRNVGETHALKVHFEGTLTMDPGATEGNESGIIQSTEVKSGVTNLVAAEADGVVFGYAHQDFHWDKFNDDYKIYPMTGDCRTESISLVGKVIWTDAFGDTRDMPFSFNRHFLTKNTSNWFGSGPDEQTALDFKKRYKESQS